MECTYINLVTSIIWCQEQVFSFELFRYIKISADCQKIVLKCLDSTNWIHPILTLSQLRLLIISFFGSKCFIWINIDVKYESCRTFKHFTNSLPQFITVEKVKFERNFFFHKEVVGQPTDHYMWNHWYNHHKCSKW